jgi:phage baseplate assembly protein W
VADLTSPSVGLDAETGGTLTGWLHVEQSLRDIFTTGFGERIMREWYGSFVPALLGRLITPSEVTPTFAAICSAIEQWEPRYRVTQILVQRATRDGRFEFFLDGEYRPRATFGDFTVEGARRVNGAIDAQTVTIRQGATA